VDNENQRPLTNNSSTYKWGLWECGREEKWASTKYYYNRWIYVSYNWRVSQ